MDNTLGIAIILFAVLGIPGLLIFSNRAEKKRQAEIQAELQRAEAIRRKAVLARRAEWGDDVCRLVIRKQVALGMTTDMVRLSWGLPNDIDQIEVTAKSTKERWIYGIPRRGAKYLWFKNDEVIKMKE